MPAFPLSVVLCQSLPWFVLAENLAALRLLSGKFSDFQRQPQAVQLLGIFDSWRPKPQHFPLHTLRRRMAIDEIPVGSGDAYVSLCGAFKLISSPLVRATSTEPDHASVSRTQQLGVGRSFLDGLLLCAIFDHWRQSLRQLQRALNNGYSFCVLH